MSCMEGLSWTEFSYLQPIDKSTGYKDESPVFTVGFFVIYNLFKSKQIFNSKEKEVKE